MDHDVDLVRTPKNTPKKMSESPSIPAASIASLDATIIAQILDDPGSYESTEQRTICHQIITKELTVEEQEIAACTSYAYWWTVVQKCNSRGCTTPHTITTTLSASTSAEEEESSERRIRMAMKEARRHWVGCDGNYELTVQSLREMCRFRKVCFPRPPG